MVGLCIHSSQFCRSERVLGMNIQNQAVNMSEVINFLRGSWCFFVCLFLVLFFSHIFPGERPDVLI